MRAATTAEWVAEWAVAIPAAAWRASFSPAKPLAASSACSAQLPGLRLEAEAMRSAARAAFHADHEPLHAVVSQEVAPTS